MKSRGVLSGKDWLTGWPAGRVGGRAGWPTDRPTDELTCSVTDRPNHRSAQRSTTPPPWVGFSVTPYVPYAFLREFSPSLPCVFPCVATCANPFFLCAFSCIFTWFFRSLLPCNICVCSYSNCSFLERLLAWPSPLNLSYHSRRSQSIEIDFGNQSIHPISIGSDRRLLSIDIGNRSQSYSLHICHQKTVLMESKKSREKRNHDLLEA